ncbi:hypothetical protein ABVT39_013512 [Epinephelus coioides]
MKNTADEVKVFKVKRNLDAGGFQQFIRAIYPELRNKVNRHRVVVPLTESTPKEIRSSGVLGRSALYVRPLCEIETDTDSSEPMDMDLASFPSASSRSSPPVSPQVSQELREVLCTLVGNLDIKALPPPANRMNVVRADILESAFRAFRREALDPERKLDVVFIDTCGQGEGSVDNGGPTREFLTLLTKALISSRFFVGPASSKNLGLDSIADEVKVFKVKRNLDAGGFQQFIRAIYPELRNKVNRHRVVVPLTESTPKEIRSSGVLGRSALYVRPLCEIETDTDSSEPMDMDLASFPSASSRSSPPVSPQVSQELREVLCTLVGNLDIKALPPPANRMNVVRADILESAFRAFRREALDPERKLDVVFIDTCGQGEGSVDNGGPTREFLTLLTKALISSRFFVGPASSKNLGLDSIGV